MRTLLKEEFQKDFLIYKKLNASKPALTCIAMVEGDNKIPFPVFLKEINLPGCGIPILQILMKC